MCSWAPGRLAQLGIDVGKAWVVVSGGAPCHHLIKWSKSRWAGTRLLRVKAELCDSNTALEYFGAHTFEEYLRSTY